MLEAVLLKERTQGLQAGRIHSGEKARECGAVRELFPAKECHERAGKGSQALVKRR
jgi:hypothetical protein